MQLTWFGGTTFRIHIGGKMLVVEAEGAPGGIDRTELLSGADRAFGLADALPEVEPRKWQPRKVGALIDEGSELPDVLVYRLAAGAVLVEAAGEPTRAASALGLTARAFTGRARALGLIR